MALNDDSEKNRGRPRTSHTDENYVIVKGLIRQDRRVKVCEIAEVTDTAKSTVPEIISDLNFCKVSALWDLKLHTKEHKSKRMAASLENLYCYQDDGESFMESIVAEEFFFLQDTVDIRRSSWMTEFGTYQGPFTISRKTLD
jgi:hypothetical protein